VDAKLYNKDPLSRAGEFEQMNPVPEVVVDPGGGLTYCCAATEPASAVRGNTRLKLFQSFKNDTAIILP
jgi:hypothetical protein